MHLKKSQTLHLILIQQSALEVKSMYGNYGRVLKIYFLIKLFDI